MSLRPREHDWVVQGRSRCHVMCEEGAKVQFALYALRPGQLILPEVVVEGEEGEKMSVMQVDKAKSVTVRAPEAAVSLWAP